MTVSDQAASPVAEPLRAKSGWVVALGVVYLIAGAVALSSVVMATVVSVFLVGIMMIVAGIAEVISALQVKSWGKFVLWLLLAALYIIAGILTFENPLLAAKLLTLLLGASLIASGIVKIVLAFNMKAGSSWGVVAFSGLITLLVGLVVVARWPVNSLYILGLFLAIDLVFSGVGWISIGLGLRPRSQEVMR
ncbi:MAG: HdeD family acid-resistance protein [Reyranella sp.]|nr:HdeD family acid-resistance protein [Reyranella sp.]MBL6652920.1 HdeD family acid-resistance protein [Reyranella sp.]